MSLMTLQDSHINHPFCKNCKICQQARYDRRFGRMSMVIPDTVQWWLNNWTIPGKLESIAKVPIPFYIGMCFVYLGSPQEFLKL